MLKCPACINTRPLCMSASGMQDCPGLCSNPTQALGRSASLGRIMAAAVASEAAPAQKQAALKRTYSSMWIGEDLDDDYGVDTSSPPKNRRAGRAVMEIANGACQCHTCSPEHHTEHTGRQRPL